jgi:hypothetical protein
MLLRDASPRDRELRAHEVREKIRLDTQVNTLNWTLEMLPDVRLLAERPGEPSQARAATLTKEIDEARSLFQKRLDAVTSALARGDLSLASFPRVGGDAMAELTEDMTILSEVLQAIPGAQLTQTHAATHTVPVEITVPALDPRFASEQSMTAAMRVVRVEQAIKAWHVADETGEDVVVGGGADEPAVVSLLADLRHYCDTHGLDFAKLDRYAYGDYRAQMATDRENAGVADTTPTPGL